MCSMCAACSASALYTQAQQTATEIRIVKRCERIESSVRTGWDADVETTCDGWHHHLLMITHDAPNLSPKVGGLCTMDKR